MNLMKMGSSVRAIKEAGAAAALFILELEASRKGLRAISTTKTPACTGGGLHFVGMRLTPTESIPLETTAAVKKTCDKILCSAEGKARVMKKAPIEY
ncbi:unnamed protein product [Bursaphelenchus xylophilus]|uniref:(pine wood nematode) hypothetical protein n=1 Tax=Bursaphelenchus xylophilus TaxID=6326 RepID=A0A811K7D2_BURXY|nr:unnamed protein product [Bursaphelenchus xylophilus]CAG9088756.1 unnamed protein product [Bursaphelenchus xylophilus]